MLDGKILRGLTGTPMRRIALAKRALAEAEPEPLTLANLMTKSLMRCCFSDCMRVLAGCSLMSQARCSAPYACCGMPGRHAPVPEKTSAYPRRRSDSALHTARSADTRLRP